MREFEVELHQKKFTIDEVSLQFGFFLLTRFLHVLSSCPSSRKSLPIFSNFCSFGTKQDTTKKLKIEDLAILFRASDVSLSVSKLRRFKKIGSILL